MPFSNLSLWILSTLLIVSCKAPAADTTSEKSKVDTTKKEVLEVTDIEISNMDTLALIQSLQGVWREPEYPFNRAEFKNTTVRMVEEGVAEASVFRPFTISHQCPYDVSNMEKNHPTDTILVFNGIDRCEKLCLSQDTLILSGYNTHTQSMYRIDYVRVQ